jgi:tRNA threonylcarbamoyladenosine biosynthesis protein TsaB
MNILIIDTSNNKKVKVGLRVDDKEEVLERESTTWKSQAVLPLIVELLNTHSLHLPDLTAIEVNEGPGSFTGLRVGAAIANTLGIWLKVPINGNPIGKIVEPKYQ